MSPLVRHIILYTSGLVSGIALTLILMKLSSEQEPEPKRQVVLNEKQNEIKRDTVEKIVYKEPRKSKRKVKVNTIDTNKIALDTGIVESVIDTVQELNINKEALLATRTFKVKSLDSNNVETNSLIDSLEQNMGISKEKNIQVIKVEYWKSPLNFEGYILGKNFVRLYGISELEELSFYSVDKKIYMRNSSGTYLLIRSEEYHKFELSNEGIQDKILQVSGNG